MKTICSSSQVRRERRGFTLIELVVIIAIIALLACLRIPALAKATGQTKRAQCASNLRQFNLAMQIYGGEYGGRLPGFSSSGGSWAWDLPWPVGSFVESTGAKWTVMYCPGTSFTEADNRQLYTFAPSMFRVIGYAHTFPGVSSVVQSNVNTTLTPSPIQIGFGIFVTPSASERVLLADATISNFGQVNPAQQFSPIYQYTGIQGGFYKTHLSPHLSGRYPMGGNLGMLDGHVTWLKFKDMRPRTQGGSPGFWW
jgi:prepilin-type N-terminal cleavage/methylation domain-containing protein/prepilin-type processing-associated H-X9-DG protein